MRYNAEELLALPNKVKRTLAKKLWQSLDDNTSFTKEDKQIIRELDRRWELIEAGKMKSYTSKQFWNKIEKYKQNKLK